MIRSSRLRVCAVLPLLAGCSLRPGFTKAGAAVAVDAASEAEARRAAVVDSLELFVPRGTEGATRLAASLGGRAPELTGRAKWKAGRGVVDVDFGKVLAALEREGALRPAGFPGHEPRVLLVVSEPLGALGVGTAGDSLRRSLYARGLTAIDGRDNLNDFKTKGTGPAALAAGAARLGADWLLIGAASSSAELDRTSGAWRAHAAVIAEQYRVGESSPVAQSRTETSAVDVTSAAARGKALEQAGEDAAGKAAAEVTRALGGRSEAALFVSGGKDVARMKSLVAAVRAVEGVAGAYLGVWRGGEDGLIVRVFLTGIKADGLAAGLMRRDPALTLLSVESDDGRLAVEMPERSIQ